MIKWADITSVFLDMDGTLLDLHFDDYFWQHHLPQRYAERHNTPLGTVKTKLAGMFDAKQGTLDWYCLDYWSKTLELNVAGLKHEVAYLIQKHDYVEDFLQRVNQLGKRVVLVTNAHPDVLKLKLETSGIKHYFHAIISSHQLGLPKENVTFWHKLQHVEAFDPEKTVFIDDSISVLSAARNYGIRHIFAVRKPSSQRPAKSIEGFDTLDSFKQILP